MFHLKENFSLKREFAWMCVSSDYFPGGVESVPPYQFYFYYPVFTKPLCCI